jgi:TP901 family phage tail tape measure protein
MAKGFNLTAELNLRGPSNIRAVISDMRRQIGTVSATVTPVLDKSSLKSISSEIKKQLGTITGNVNVRLSPSSAKNIANDVKKQLSSISANINIGVNASAVKSAGKTIKQQLSGLVVPIGVSASSASINQIRSRIRNQLGNLNVTVNVRLNSGVNQTLNTYNTNLTRLNNLLIQTATNATAAANSIDALAAAMRSASSVRLQPINTNLGNIGNNATRTSQAINGATGEVENFGRQAGLAIRRFAAFSTVAGVAYGITNALKNGVAAYIEYDQQLTKISQVTGDAKDKLGDITSTINNLSTSLGVSSSELASTTLTLAQAGLTAKETEQALKALALSALAPSFDDMNQTVEGSIALMRQFNIGSSQLESALGSINAVSAKFAVEASDIITAIQRTGGVFAASSRGVSEGTNALNEFIAVFTSIRATTRESAETIATGLRTIFTRIQRSETIEALKEFGVTLTDLEGKFVGPYIAVQRLSEGLSRLDPRDLKFSSIVEELGGFRQIGKVLPLIQQFSTAQDALKIAQQGQGSLAIDAAKGQQALAVQISKVRQEFLALIRSVGNTDTFQNIVKVGLDLASALIKVAEAAKGLVPLLGLFAALKGAQAVTQFAGGFGRGFRGVGPGQRAAEGGPIRHFASGGYVPGFGNGDTVSARLTPGEFVMRKSAVQSIGVGNLHSLNRSRGGITTPINRYASGTESSGGVKQFRDTSIYTRGKKKTAFAHLDEQIPVGKSASKAMKLQGNWVGLTNVGLDLPASWNLDWSKPRNYRGVPATKLANYIENNDVFNSLLTQGGKIYGKFSGGAKSPALAVLKKSALEIRQKLSQLLKDNPIPSRKETIKNKEVQLPAGWYDTDPDIISRPKTLFFQAINSVLGPGSKAAKQLREGLKETRAFRNKTTQEEGVATVNGKEVNYGRTIKFSADKQRALGSRKITKSSGGFVQKFMAGDLVEPVAVTSTKKASTSEIIKLLGLETAAKIGGISATDVYTTLNKRAPTPQQAASKAAILAEFTKKQNRLSGAKQARTTRITSKGLLFGAAGMLGSAFAPINKKITSDQLKAPVDVRIISGIMDPKVASATEQSFTSSLNKTAGIAAKKVMVADILAKAGLGRELNLDFDRTLAFGADKILSDPKTPKFAEFGDRNKVAAALKGAKLSLLGKELAGLVSTKPELLGNLKLITARPASTLDLVQGWLSSKGLPIPLSQFKGLGGPGVSGSQIAKLKAALLSPGSLFVDDDARNIKAAKARSKEGIIPYRYGNRKISGNPNAEATAQGTLFEKMIQKLGGPGALKGQGMDFPQGLKGAAKYFGIPGNIATDAKRTINGPSTVEDNIITYLKVKGYNTGGAIQRFPQGGTPEPTPRLIQRGGFKYELDKVIAAGFTEAQFMKQIPVPGGYGEQWQIGGMGEGSIPMPPSLQPYKAPPSDIQRRVGEATITRQTRIADAVMKDGRTMRDYEASSDQKAFKKMRGYAVGGHSEHMVPALVSNGEAYIPPEEARSIGLDKLREMNRADRNGMKSFARGGISVFKGPGSGTSDSIGPIGLPVGSFIVRAAATKALGLSSGGSVGNVQELAAGGAVQRFFFGGSPVKPRPDNPTAANIGVSDSIVSQLREVTEALTQLGITSSSTADLFRKGGAISYQAATRSMEADLLRMRIAGASAATLYQAEQRLNNVREAQARDLNTRQQLKGVSGEQLQEIDTRSSSERQKLIKKERKKLVSSGLSSDEVEERLGSDKVQNKINRKAYQKATTQTLGASTANNLFKNGVSGSDIDQYTRQAMMDRKTLAQMDSQLRRQKQQELTSSTTYRNASAAQQKKMLAGLKQQTDNEINARRKLVNDLSRQQGMSGPGSGGRMSGQGLMGAAFGVQMIGSLIAQNINAESSSGNAQLSAGLQGGTNMLATGAMIGGGVKDMLPSLGKLAGPLGIAAVAAAAIGQALIDAKNAALAFEKKMIQNKLNSALEETALEFVKLEKDIKDINIQRTITSKLAEAANMAKASMDINSKMAKTFWVNMLDSFGSNEKEGISSQSAAADRADILDKKGIGAYFASTGFGQAMGSGGALLQNIQDLMAGKKASEMTGNIQAEQTRSSYVQDLIPGRAEESAKQFTPVAESINKLIINKAKGGANIGDLITEFKGAGSDINQFGVTLAMADKAVNAQIQSIENSLDLTSDEKKARQDLIISMHAEAAIRKQAAVAEREAAMKALENSTSNFARSLERMFQNMEQSINKTNFGLEQMSRDLDLVSSSLKGEAKIGSGSLKSVNVLQNPNAYSGAENNSARSQAASMFSGSTNVMKGLLSIGSDLESSVLSTINNTIRKNPGSNNEKMGFAIQKAVQEQLDSLQLPPDISSKLSGEVSKALEDMRKSGDDKVDFSQLVEKIPQLSKVIESSKRAQEVALKALENWQNALNSYSTRMNELADLQIDTNAKLRKSTQILTDGQLELAKTLGKTIDVSDVRRNVEATTAQQTGGPTRPQDIANQILGLDNTRKAQEGSSDIARQRGPQGADDFVRMQNNLRNTNVALRENYDALKHLAENTEVASAALNKIQEAQQKNEGKVGFIEKLVTSTPEEFNSLNAAFGRLQNNIRGQVNTIQNSQSAQKAYAEALNNGASGFEAMKAAQVAFANDRKETLSALKDVMPFLGDNKQANNIKANVLESMLQESGQGVSPVFQQILNTLRNPQADPETQAAMQQYQQAISTQSDANKQLARLNDNLASQIANKSAEALTAALTNSKVTFENKELSDIAANVRAIENKLGDKPVPAVGKVSGGVIYAAAGMNVDFAPKGTDTVPAMLTPGEFVVNRTATQANLPLLQSINSNKFSSGGKVSYYADGGYVSDFMKTKSRDSDNFNLTQDSYLDLNKNNKLIDNASEKALAGSQIFTRLQRNGLKKSPKNDSSDMDFQNDNIWDNSGDIVAGFTAPIMVSERFAGGTRAQYAPLDRSSKDLAEFQPVLTDKLLVGRENLEVSKVSKIEAANYSTKLRAKYPTLSLDKLNLGNELDSIGDFPSSVEPSTLNNSVYNPNENIGHRAGLYFGSPPPIPSVDFNSAPMNKIWTARPLMGFGWLDAVSSSEPSYDSGDYASQKFGPSMMTNKPNIMYYPGISSKDTDSKYLKNRSQIDSLIEKHNENKNIIAQALDFDDTKVRFDQSVNSSYDKLMQSFSALYNGTSSHEDLTGEVDLLKTFGPFGKPRTLFVFPNTPYINSTLQDTVESLNLDQAKANGVQFGIDKKDPGLKNKELAQWFNLFDVTSTVAGGAPKHFPWMMNIGLDSLGKNFEEKAKEDVVNQMKNGPIKKQSLGFKMDKLSIPVGGKNLDLNYGVEYTKYSAPLWDEKTRSFSKDPARQLKDIFIPEPNKSPLDIFQQLEIDKKRIYNSSEFTSGDLLNKVQAIPLLDQYYDALINNDQTKQDNLSKQIKANDIISFSNALGLASNAPDAMNSLIFNDIIPRGANLEVGDWLINAIKDLSSATKNSSISAVSSIDNPNQLGDIIGGNPGEIKDAVQKLGKGALGVFGRRKIPGFGSGWAFRYLRGVPGFGARPLKDDDMGKQAAAYASNVFNEAGAYASQLFYMARSPQQYNAIKEAYGLLTGATSAFGGIAGGNTRFIKTMLDNGDAESLFRSLGASSNFQKAGSRELSQDFKATLGKSLKGSKIRTIGADGSLTYENFTNQVPKTYTELVDLGLNPYNEFANIDTRKNIISKLRTDISQGKDSLGMPFYDPQTASYIDNALSSLLTWYSGGIVGWPGQDYFYDKNLPEKDRTDAVIQSIKSGRANQVRDNANLANTQLGVSAKYGELPSAEWFEARQMAEPQMRANGGMIYAANGQMVNFQPRGTDTVPAMLTPGEFVINREATQRNLPLLKSINDGNHYSTGGVVNYLARGGLTVQKDFTKLEKEKYFDGYDLNKDGILDDKEYTAKGTIFDYVDFRQNREGEGGNRDGKINLAELNSYNAAYDHHIQEYLSAAAKTKYAKLDPQKQKLGGGDLDFLQTYEAANKVKYQNRKISRNTLEEKYYSGDPNYPFTQGTIDREALIQKKQADLGLGMREKDLTTFGYGLASKVIPGILSVAMGGLGFVGGSFVTPVAGSAAGAVLGGVAGDQLGQYINRQIYELLPTSLKNDIAAKIEKYPESYNDGQWTGFAAEIAGGSAMDSALSKTVASMTAKKLTKQVIADAVKSGDSSLTKLATVGSDVLPPEKAAKSIADDLGDQAATNSSRVDKSRSTGESSWWQKRKDRKAAQRADRAETKAAKAVAPGILEKLTEIQSKFNSNIGDAYNTALKRKYDLFAETDAATTINSLDSIRAQAAQFHLDNADELFKSGVIQSPEDIARAIDNSPLYLAAKSNAKETFARLGIDVSDDFSKLDANKTFDDYFNKDYDILNAVPSNPAAAAKRQQILDDIANQYGIKPDDLTQIRKQLDDVVVKPKVGRFATINGLTQTASLVDHLLKGRDPRGIPSAKSMERPEEKTVPQAQEPGLPPIQPGSGGRKEEPKVQEGSGSNRQTPDGIKQKYYDELTYKEYLASLISSGKAPEEPEKKLFSTPAFYTNNKDYNDPTKTGEKTRVTAYDTRATNKPVGSSGKVDETQVDPEVLSRLAGSIYGETNNAFTQLSDYNKLKTAKVPDEALMDKTLEILETSYGAAIGSLGQLSKLTNLSKVGNKSIMIGEKQDIPVSIDDMVSRLQSIKSSYYSEVLAKEKAKTKINDSILDEFGSKTASVVEQNPLPPELPESGKFSGKQVRQERMEPDQKVRGMTGIETQYKNAYAHYRRILGEYNYHKSIGKSDRYAKGNKTTSKVAKTLSLGGVVYASQGMMIPYEPRGTDTVPAMLTPGEFVVNRAATQANLPLLKAINNGQTKGFSKGGVVYLASGGDTSQRDKALSQSPAGQLILTIRQQAESNANLFEALDSSAFSDISSGDLENKYNEVWSKLDADARYNAAKTQFTQDKKRVDYLTGVYNNAASAYATLKGNQLAANTKIGDINILQLLKAQEAAMSEAKAIHMAWVSLAQKYPEFRADIGQGGTQAAGTGAVAGTPPKPDKGADKPPEKEPVNKRYGGMIYAATGGALPFTPISRGTDTVPAMLTPGEFVVNRTSTQRNLPLLQAINNNRYSKGGKVNYLNRGGQVLYLANAGQVPSEGQGGGGVSTGGGSASVSTDGLSQFTTTFQSFIDQLKNLNPVINLKGEHNVNVNFNGAQYLAAMDESIRRIVVSEVNAAMDKLHRDTEGAVGGK